MWETLTGSAVVPCDVPPYLNGPTATIAIGGPWIAMLEVITSAKLARHFAATLFAMTDDELSEPDIHDALGELANVVGGNVKGAIDDVEGTTLSLPVVTNDRPTIKGGALTVQCGFDVDGESMVWALFERV